MIFPKDYSRFPNNLNVAERIPLAFSQKEYAVCIKSRARVEIIKFLGSFLRKLDSSNLLHDIVDEEHNLEIISDVF